MFVISASSGQTVGSSQCLSSTDSIWQSQTELTAVFRLAAIEDQTAVVAVSQILGSARANRTRLKSISTATAEKTQAPKIWLLDSGHRPNRMERAQCLYGQSGLGDPCPAPVLGIRQVGNSDLKTQKRLLKIGLPLLKPYPVLVLVDREFHSPKLAEWLDSKGVMFALRQKKDLHFQVNSESEYTVVKDLGIQPGITLDVSKTTRTRPRDTAIPT